MTATAYRVTASCSWASGEAPAACAVVAETAAPSHGAARRGVARPSRRPAHSLDLPAVAVLDPVRAAHAEPSIVAAADHHVVDVGRAAIRERRGCSGWAAGSLGSQVQLPDKFTRRREDEAVPTAGALALPGLEDLVDRAVGVADVNRSLSR